MDRSEIKVKLRDWMTAINQLTKVEDHTLTPSDISFMWRRDLGIKMNEKWVERSLYGARKR